MGDRLLSRSYEWGSVNSSMYDVGWNVRGCVVGKWIWEWSGSGSNE